MATRFTMQTGPSSAGFYTEKSTSYAATNASTNRWFGMSFSDLNRMGNYVSEVVNAERRRQESAARQQANIAGIELQIKQLPETLNLLESQYSTALDLLTRKQEVENAQFAPQRQQMAAQQELDRRKFQKEVGSVEASFGARGLAFSNTAMADMRRQASLLRQVDEAQNTLLTLSEKETGIKQEDARNSLKDQIDNSRLSIRQKIDSLNTELDYQKKIANTTNAKLVAGASSVTFESGQFGSDWSGGLTGGSYNMGGKVTQAPMDFLYDVAMGLASDSNFTGKTSEILNATAKYLGNSGVGIAGQFSEFTQSYNDMVNNAIGVLPK